VGIGTAIRGLLSGAPVYVRFSRDRTVLREAGNRRVVDEEPVVAITTEKPFVILAVGRGAAAQAASQRKPYELVNGFDHPRAVIGDFPVAEKTLQYLLRQLLGSSLLKPSPVMVIHPLDSYAGGLSQIEVRALQELGAGAGAREVHVWDGEELTDQALQSGVFRTAAGRLTSESRFQGR